MLCAIFVFVACDLSISEPDYAPHPDAYPIDARPEWHEWYRGLGECMDVAVYPERVEYFAVPGGMDWQSTYNGETTAGEWWPPHRIYIAEGRLDDGSIYGIVRHEQAHDLIQSGDHPDPPFGSCVIGPTISSRPQG